MKPFTYKEYLAVYKLYEEYMDTQSTLRNDSSDDEWEICDNLGHAYHEALHKLVFFS